MFKPNQIIFSVTDKCNLKCAHCFVERKNNSLEASDAISFINECLNSNCTDEWKVGFSGGEPFLNLDFMCQVSAFCVEKNVMFDRLMTNAIWWKSESELCEKLQKLFESGFDGKFGISFDSFHGADFRYTAKFCQKVYELWQNPTMIEIQTTYSTIKQSLHTLKKQKKVLSLLAMEMGGKFYFGKGKNAFIKTENQFIRVDFSKQSFNSTDKLAPKEKKWFKDDFCKLAGNIFYVHADKNIAPCCGFANENEKLFIGKLGDSFEKIMENANQNKMVLLCFEKGLKTLQKNSEFAKCKTQDACVFCDYVCKSGFVDK